VDSRGWETKYSSKVQEEEEGWILSRAGEGSRGRAQGRKARAMKDWKVFRNPPSGEVPSRSMSALEAVSEKGYPSF
jgi:hypothetical protein